MDCKKGSARACKTVQDLRSCAEAKSAGNSVSKYTEDQIILGIPSVASHDDVEPHPVQRQHTRKVVTLRSTGQVRTASELSRLTTFAPLPWQYTIVLLAAALRCSKTKPLVLTLESRELVKTSSCQRCAGTSRSAGVKQRVL